MDIFKDFGSNYCVQVSFHEIKNQVDILIIFCFYQLLKANDIRMAI